MEVYGLLPIPFSLPNHIFHLTKEVQIQITKLVLLPKVSFFLNKIFDYNTLDLFYTYLQHLVFDMPYTFLY